MRYEGNDGYLLKWYAEESTDWQYVLEEIKDLPLWDRQYFPDEKCWWIDESAVEKISPLFANADLYFKATSKPDKDTGEMARLRSEVDMLQQMVRSLQATNAEKTKLLAKAYEDMEWLKRKAANASPAVPKTTVQSFTELYLLPSAPLSVVKASFKTLAQVYHPDHGGNHQKMVALNAAYALALKYAQQHERKIS